MSEQGGASDNNRTNPAADPEIADMQELASAAADGFHAERERLAAEVAAFKDKYLRAFAEAENIRRRAEREIADAKTYGVTSFARDVLNVADDLARALGAVEADVKEKAEGGVKSLLDGLELTERSLLKALEKYGVRRIEPKGQRFDPHLHQAMFEIPDETVPSGTVLQVVQAGYVIGDRVARPAMVGVSRGGPKPPREEKADAKGDAGEAGEA